jgi:hypothetical protein
MELQKVELTEKIFLTIEEQIPLTEFEQWLYSQKDLLENLHEDLILTSFTFNYNQKDALYEFKNTFTQYFDEDVFMLWKVKINLVALINNHPTRDRILYDFRWLGDRDYPFLSRIGYYGYEFEEIEYISRSEAELLEELKMDAQELLDEITEQEKTTPDFTLKRFRRPEKPIDKVSIVSQQKESISVAVDQPIKKWWKFWN